MELKQWSGKALELIKKYRYPILVLAIGILLMTLPTGEKSKQETQQPAQEAPEEKVDISAQLEAILSQIKGVGKVKVLLTQAMGEVYIYQFDENGDRKETVIITDGDRNESPILSQVVPPKYQGAVIVCQGAEVPAVKLAVVEAVSRLTGLGADHISVLKMK